MLNLMSGAPHTLNKSLHRTNHEKFSITNLHEANIEIFSRVPSSKVPTNVHVVVSYDSCDHVGCGDPRSSLGGHEFPHVFDWLVDVLNTTSVVGKVVMGNKVNLA